MVGWGGGIIRGGMGRRDHYGWNGEEGSLGRTGGRIIRGGMGKRDH